jgi:hypothetical protein
MGWLLFRLFRLLNPQTQRRLVGALFALFLVSFTVPAVSELYQRMCEGPGPSTRRTAPAASGTRTRALKEVPVSSTTRRRVEITPKREEWGAISLRIARSLKELRERWFPVCVNGLRESKFKVRRASLSGEADRATRAFQLYLVANYLSQHAYIPTSEGRDFADILFAQVCGTELEECLVPFSRYAEVQTDRGAVLFRFSADIARYITGNDTPLPEAMAVAETTPTFGILTHMIVADAFGDMDTVSELQAELAPQH